VPVHGVHAAAEGVEELEDEVALPFVGGATGGATEGLAAVGLGLDFNRPRLSFKPNVL
jgi:hypothetical protein